MPRDYKVSLEDMQGSSARIRTLTSGMSYEEFTLNVTIQEAVIRNLEIIGEKHRQAFLLPYDPSTPKLIEPGLEVSGMS